jgi:VanZ family protein
MAVVWQETPLAPIPRAHPRSPRCCCGRERYTTAVKNFFRLGLAAHLTLVVLISAGAYLGILPTSVHGVPYADKLGHAVLIGGLAFFLDGALEHRRLHPSLSFPRLGPALVLFVAAIEEYLQRFSARRSSDIMDYAADIVGVCFFAWLSLRVDARLSPARA